jgi:Ca2+/Na+ antiporter
MTDRRYWGLFWIAMAMAVHSVIVGRLLGSSFFMLLFFWGWVAAAAYRGKLESARAMAITMVVLLVGVTVVLALRPAEFQNELAYYTFALYPALVSWICVYFYVRHLMQRDDHSAPLHRRAAPQRRNLLNWRGMFSTR